MCLLLQPITKLGVYNKGQTKGVLVLPGTFTLALSRNSSRKPSAASRFHAGRTEIRYKFFLGFVSAFFERYSFVPDFLEQSYENSCVASCCENAEECFN